MSDPRPALAACLLVTLLGCHESQLPDRTSGSGANPSAVSSEPDQATSAASDVGNTSPPDKPTQLAIKLIEPGAEPRKLLRYNFLADQRETMVMEMRMVMQLESGGQGQPEIRLPGSRNTMTVKGTEVSPEGELRYTFELQQIEILPPPDTDPSTTKALQQNIDKMRGLSGSATVTSRGLTKHAELKPPPDADPQIVQFMTNMKHSMNQMSAPFPAEAVGQGARWEVTMPVETPVLKLTQVATYTLQEVHGDRAVLDVEIEQTAPPQQMENRAAGPGVKVALESLNTSGSGQLEVRLSSLVPTSQLELTTVNVFSTSGRSLKTTTQIGIQIHP